MKTNSTIFARDLVLPEGPVALPDGSWLVVDLAPERGCVTHISKDGQDKRTVAKTGRPVGLAVDSDGVLWVAEAGNPSLIRLTMDGRAEVVATGCAGEPFLFPNDLCFGPDGTLYMTDSGILFEDLAPDGPLRKDLTEEEMDGRVYRIEPTSGKVEKMDSGLGFLNGIAFGPDGSLYTNDTITGMVYRYRQRDDGSFGGREDVASVVEEAAPGTLKGPDGMAFGDDGRLYVAVYGQGDVTVLSPEGKVVDRLPTAGKLPTNVAFALPGEKKIYVTEDELGQVEVFGVGTDGLALHSQPRH